MAVSTSYAYADFESLEPVAIEKNMLDQIQLGESLFRDDIINDALTRLYRVSPNHAQGLLAELRLAIRLDQLDRARELLSKLQKRVPNSVAYKQAKLLFKLTEPQGREQLAQARLFAAAGRFGEARKAYEDLLQGYYPSADLAVEYWQVRTQENRQRPLAINALTDLLQDFPRHPSIFRALVNYHFQENQPTQAIHYLHLLAEQKSQREWAGNREYDYLIALPVSIHTRSLWSDFTARYDGLESSRKGQVELDRQIGLLGDKYWQAGQAGLRLLETGNNAQSIVRLHEAIKAYPNDVELHGALGMAYSLNGNRKQALYYFRLAKDKELRADETSKWISLIESTEYWMLLSQADDALKSGRLVQARQLYSQAHRRDPRNIFALLGLGNAALADEDFSSAWLHYKKAWQLDPGRDVTQLGVLRYIATLPTPQALDVLTPLVRGNTPLLLEAKIKLQIEALKLRAEYAQHNGLIQERLYALAQIQELDLSDAWNSYELALALRAQGKEDVALAAYKRHLSAYAQEPVSRYAHGLLLAAVEQWEAVLATLNAVPKLVWSQDMHDLAQRVEYVMLLEQAQKLYSQGDTQPAFTLLETLPSSQAARSQLAQWAYEEGRYKQSLDYYNDVLEMEPDNFDARVGVLENWAAQGQLDQVRVELEQPWVTAESSRFNAPQRFAELWVSVGEPQRARVILQHQEKLLTGPDAVFYRALARLTAQKNPQKALDFYALGLRDADLLPAAAVVTKRDNVAFTTAMRQSEDDDWLATALRSEAEELYLRETPTFTLHHDTAWRTDGKQGLSRLNANTTIAHFEFPLNQGRAFLRADHVRMDAGRLKKSTDGSYSDRFGSCSFSGADTGGAQQSLAGCKNGLSQKADGTGFAFGWADEQLSFDLGSTPYGFTVQNLAGGISYSDKVGVTGWSLTASRRPLSNSLLSFAGAQDPRTGIKWGGVMANGASLGLSWDQGNANGVWADISHHQLKGKNVADNRRTQLMGGYYRRLINTSNELLTVGASSMLWNYKKDLGEYTLGHGGYYSPQRYISFAVPVRYAKRTVDWSYIVEGSVSASVSKTRDMAYYPKRGLIAGPWQDLAQQGSGVSETAFNSDNSYKGGRGRGVGYSMRGLVERRLDNHWVLGTGIDLQKSKDYSPSRAMLYLRYSFAPWQGNLKLPIEPLTPYADFK